MKSKAMAVLAAVMMIGIAFGAMSVQTDAAVTPTHLEDVTVSDRVTTKKLAFTTNEGEFKGYDYEVKFYALEWNGSDDVTTMAYGSEVGTTTATVGGNPNYTGTSKGIPGTSSKFNVSLESAGTGKNGTYFMKVERIDAFTQQRFVLKTEIEVKLGLATVTNPKYQTYYEVTVKDGSVADITLSDMTDVEGGKFYGKQVVVTGPTPFTVANYKWYAYNLPAGLSMSETGYVSGIYVGNVAVINQEAKVIAVSDAATYQGTMKVSCTAYTAPEALTVKVTDTTGGGSTVISDASYVLRVVDADMKFKVEVTRGTSPVTGATIDVVAVGTDGTVAKLTPDTGNEYTAPTTGTGAYKVIVTAYYGVVEEATSSFTLYVLPSYGNVVAQIIPGST